MADAIAVPKAQAKAKAKVARDDVRTVHEPMTLHITAVADSIHDALLPVLKAQLAHIMSVPTPLERSFVEWAGREKPTVYNADLERNYGLLKEYVLEMAPALSALGDFETAFVLLSISLNLHGETIYHQRGGKGKCREWGRVEAARFRTMLTHLTKSLRKSDAARNQKVDVLKRMWHLKASKSDEASEEEDADAPACAEEADLQAADRLAEMLSPRGVKHRGAAVMGFSPQESAPIGEVPERAEPGEGPDEAQPQADREPLIRFRDVPRPEFMDASHAYQRYDHVTAAQDVVRTRIREAAAEVENKRIDKRKRDGGRRGFKVDKAAKASKDEQELPEDDHPDGPALEKGDDDDEAAEAARKPAPKRNSRLSKLLKKVEAASASNPGKDAAPKKPAKNSKPQNISPKKSKASSKRLDKALSILETLKKEDLPGLQCPEELKKQSFTVYHNGEKEKKGSTSAISVILRSESFYVRQVLQQVEGPVATDRKGGATVPWHHFDGAISIAWHHARLMAGWVKK
ncbi:unnamed protein product [Symbiodinium sp. CCMP2456]|nr:unnamed protein product [Symbiodinium sp. CCMP2456]